PRPPSRARFWTPTCSASSRPPTRKSPWSFRPMRRSKSRRQAPRSDAEARPSPRASETPLDRTNEFMEFFDPGRRPPSQEHQSTRGDGREQGGGLAQKLLRRPVGQQPVSG